MKRITVIIGQILFVSCFSSVTLGSVPLVEKGIDQLWNGYPHDRRLWEPAIQFPHEKHFREASRQYNLPVSLLIAIARGESDFDRNARSDRSCYGIMQIRWPQTAHHLEITSMEDLLDPRTNILAGARYVRELLDRYDQNLHLSLCAYNYGPGRISRNIALTDIPDGARWYSAYIYRHLTYVTGRKSAQVPKDYIQEAKRNIIVFNRPYRAEAFIDYVKQKNPSLRLDWFRTGLRRFQVVLLYNGNEELKQGQQQLKAIGYSTVEMTK